MLTRTPQTNSNPWVVCPKPNSEATVRLFCFPYSGAGASIFFKWPDSLMPAGIELCAVQLPGRGPRLAEPLLTSLGQLVQSLAHALIPYLEEPFAFFGHSMGALLGFELARHLRRHYGLSPLHLFCSGHGAPHLPRRSEAAHRMSEADFLATLRRLNGMPDEVLENAELMELLMPILRADFALSETYVFRPDRLLDCPISAYGGLYDDQVKREQLGAWSEMTKGEFSLRMFPGDHFYMNTERPLLLRTLATELEASRSAHAERRALLAGRGPASASEAYFD